MTHPCLDCGAPTDRSRCAACSPQADVRNAHNPLYDDPRWRRLSRRILVAHVRSAGPNCPGLPPDHHPHPCHDLVVDHLVSPKDGGALLDPSNCRVLCRVWNSRRAVEQTRARRGGVPKSTNGGRKLHLAPKSIAPEIERGIVNA